MISLSKTYKTLKFVSFYIIKLFQANLYIAYDILTPKALSNPGFIWIPIRIKSKFGFLLFSNLVSMTPGTLSVDYSKKRKALLVHYLYNKIRVVKQLEIIQDKIIDFTS